MPSSRILSGVALPTFPASTTGGAAADYVVGQSGVSSIQQAIDLAHAAYQADGQLRTVVVPWGTYTENLDFKSGVYLRSPAPATRISGDRVYHFDPAHLTVLVEGIHTVDQSAHPHYRAWVDGIHFVYSGASTSPMFTCTASSSDDGSVRPWFALRASLILDARGTSDPVFGESDTLNEGFGCLSIEDSYITYNHLKFHESAAAWSVYYRRVDCLSTRADMSTNLSGWSSFYALFEDCTLSSLLGDCVFELVFGTLVLYKTLAQRVVLDNTDCYVYMEDTRLWGKGPPEAFLKTHATSTWQFVGAVSLYEGEDQNVDAELADEVSVERYPLDARQVRTPVRRLSLDGPTVDPVQLSPGPAAWNISPSWSPILVLPAQSTMPGQRLLVFDGDRDASPLNTITVQPQPSEGWLSATETGVIAVESGFLELLATGNGWLVLSSKVS